MASIKEVHPTLPVRDLQRAIDFYVDRLGFSLAFRDPSGPDRYAGVRRDGVERHLQWHDEADFAAPSPASPGTAMLRFLVDDPDDLYREFQARGALSQGAKVEDKPWGTREFAFYGIDGHGLTFYRDRG